MSFVDNVLGIWKGFGITLIVTLLSLLYAVPFALLFGVLQHKCRGAVRAGVTSIIEFWRSSPVVILMFVFYYTLPAAGITLSAMTVGTMVLGLNIGGYASQAVRAALQNLDRGQTEAARSLGLSALQCLILVELPQTLKVSVPSFVNLVTQLIKGTSLVSLVSLADMTYHAKEIAQVTFEPVPAYLGLLISYFVICYPIASFGRLLETRMKMVSRAE